MLAEERRDLVGVFLRQHRAGDVDERAAGLHEPGAAGRARRAARPGARGMFAGFRRHFASGLRRQVPEPVHGASTSTTSKRGPSASERRLVAGVQDLDVAHARPLHPLEDRPQLPLVGVVGVDLAGVLHARRRAPASCRRRRRTDRAPACAAPAPQQRRDLRALVLHLEPARRAPPRPEVRACAPRPSGAGMRTPSGDSGVGSALKRCERLQTFSRVAFSVLTRRSTGARALSAAPSRPRRPRTRARTTAAAIPG